MQSPNVYNREYFENGIVSGKSNYVDYRWLPERTLSMAMIMIDFLGIDKKETILDYGCAKGFLVKAFRLLHRRAWGVDISKYAIENADESVLDFCFLKQDQTLATKALTSLPDSFDYCIAKDVFEHIEEKQLEQDLRWIWSHEIDTMFAVVPLGAGGEFVAPANNADVTHVTCYPTTWWCDLFQNNNWKVKNIRFQLEGIKDAYYAKYPTAHGFFTLKRTN